MFNKLIPWKKRSGDVKVGYDDHSIGRFRDEIDHLWDHFWDDWRGGRGLSLWDNSSLFNSRMFGSLVDWDDTEKEYVLRAEVPGFEPDDFDIKVSGNVLTLRAEHKEEKKAKKGQGSYHHYGSFYESVTLPNGVLSDQIDARYHSGVLEIHLPKSEECQGKRIEVTSA